MLQRIFQTFIAIISLVPGIIVGWIGVTLGVFEDCLAQVRRERAEYTHHFNHKSDNFRMKYLLRKANSNNLKADDVIRATTLHLPPLPIALLVQFIANLIVYPSLMLRATVAGPKRTYKLINKLAIKLIPT